MPNCFSARSLNWGGLRPIVASYLGVERACSIQDITNCWVWKILALIFGSIGCAPAAGHSFQPNMSLKQIPNSSLPLRQRRKSEVRCTLDWGSAVKDDPAVFNPRLSLSHSNTSCDSVGDKPSNSSQIKPRHYAPGLKRPRSTN
jgi:hypothetical protein